MPDAGVGPSSGGNRVGFKGELEQDGVLVAKSGVGVEAPNGAQAGSRQNAKGQNY